MREAPRAEVGENVLAVSLDEDIGDRKQAVLVSFVAEPHIRLLGVCHVLHLFGLG